MSAYDPINDDSGTIDGPASSNGNGAQALVASDPPVVNARNWRKKSQDGEWYTLPAANEPAKLRRPSFTTLAARIGMVPNRLANEVVDLLADLGQYRNRPQNEQMEAFLKNSRAFVLIARECFVEPKLNTNLQCENCGTVVDYTVRECTQCRGKHNLRLMEADYDNGEISPLDIPDFDFTWLVFSFVEGSDARVKDFRHATTVDELGRS